MRLLKLLLAAAVLFYPAAAAADVIEIIFAADGTSSFTASTGVFTTLPGDPTTVDPTLESLRGKSFHVEMVKDGSEPPGTGGTRFVGTDDGLPDVTVYDGGTLLLALDIDFMKVNSVNVNFITTFNIGGLSGEGLSGLTIVGGDLMDDFGGYGAPASMLINATILGGTLGHIFDANFDTIATSYNVYLDPPAGTPEPSTLLLLGAGLAGLAFRARTGRRRR